MMRNSFALSSLSASSPEVELQRDLPDSPDPPEQLAKNYAARPSANFNISSRLPEARLR